METVPIACAAAALSPTEDSAAADAFTMTGLSRCFARQSVSLGHIPPSSSISPPSPHRRNHQRAATTTGFLSPLGPKTAVDSSCLSASISPSTASCPEMSLNNWSSGGLLDARRRFPSSPASSSRGFPAAISPTAVSAEDEEDDPELASLVPSTTVAIDTPAVIAPASLEPADAVESSDDLLPMLPPFIMNTPENSRPDTEISELLAAPSPSKAVHAVITEGAPIGRCTSCTLKRPRIPSPVDTDEDVEARASRTASAIGGALNEEDDDEHGPSQPRRPFLRLEKMEQRRFLSNISNVTTFVPPISPPVPSARSSTGTSPLSSGSPGSVRLISPCPRKDVPSPVKRLSSLEQADVENVEMPPAPEASVLNECDSTGAVSDQTAAVALSNLIGGVFKTVKIRGYWRPGDSCAASVGAETSCPASSSLFRAPNGNHIIQNGNGTHHHATIMNHGANTGGVNVSAFAFRSLCLSPSPTALLST